MTSKKDLELFNDYMEWSYEDVKALWDKTDMPKSTEGNYKKSRELWKTKYCKIADDVEGEEAEQMRQWKAYVVSLIKQQRNLRTAP